MNLRNISQGIFPLGLAILGVGIFMFSRTNNPDLGALITGFVWTLIPIFLPQSIIYKIRNHHIVTKFLRLYDPPERKSTM